MPEIDHDEDIWRCRAHASGLAVDKPVLCESLHRVVAAAEQAKRLAAALEELLTLNDPAGLTPKIVSDGVMFREFCVAVQELTSDAITKARAALASYRERK